MKDLFVSFMNKFLYQIFEALVFLLILAQPTPPVGEGLAR